MGKLLYSFRIIISLFAILVFFLIFYGGAGDFILGLFRFGNSDIYIDPGNGAFFNPQTNVLKLVISQKEINEGTGLEIIFYNDDGSSKSFYWTGSLNENHNVLYFDMNDCFEKRTDVLAVSLIVDNVKSMTTHKVEVREETFETEGVVYDLCNHCESGGKGSRDSLIVICSCSELQNVSADLTKYYSLGNNIDCSGFEFQPIGDDVKPFRGTFDGKGYYIYNLRINQEDDYAGLFGVLYEGEVTNLGLVYGNVFGNLFVGSLVGRQEGGEISKVYSREFVVQGTANVGGLVGYSNGKITNCYSISNITASIFGGGIVGGLGGEVENCYFSGVVDSVYNGLIGKTFEGYSVLSSYYNTELMPETKSIAGISKSQSELMQEETYKNWDFEKVWVINENINYPYLTK